MYIEKLEGFSSSYGKDIICRLKKVLYGLRRAPRVGYKRPQSYMIKIGFIETIDDSNVYLKVDIKEDMMLIKMIFVDDIIFGENDELRITFIDEMKK